MSGAVDKPDFFISRVEKKSVSDYCPLWAGENDATLRRTVEVLNGWFGLVGEGSAGWWALGAEPGGGLAMNDGVTVILNVLRSVFRHLEGSGKKLVNLDDHELLELIKPYGAALGDHFGSLDEEERRQFRELRGTQGQTTGTRRCQQALQRKFPSFDPPG